MTTLLSSAIDDFLDHCRISKRLSANTLRAYETDLADFLSHVGKDTLVASIDRDRLRHYARTLFDAKGLKETTVKRRMAALKVMFRWLERDEVIELSPFHRLDLSIRLPRRLPRALSADEMRRLLNAAERDLAYGHDEVAMYFAIICLFVTGLRVGELASADIAEVDSREASILVRGKGNRERRVFLTGGDAVGALNIYLAARDKVTTSSQRLLVSAAGDDITPQFIRRKLATLGKRARIERRLTPHMLRHTAATQLIEAGVDIRFVQKLLGHASIATTQIYTQVSDSSLRDTMERAGTLARVRGGSGG
jgi:site-specific recombinase XerD